ncbi:hypothetical protein, partial [Halobacteriovorax sp.]|uniref:hypothetical protein n=1 Tax=Halobacteriovorax sp. TaxID=2020862 RepID=UPI00356576CC
MSRLLLVLSLILYSFQSYAGKYDEALSNVKKHLSDRASMYEKEFKNSHERRVSDFYYRRSLSRQVISQELIEQSYLDYLLLTELSGSIDSESSDISELYYLSKNLSEFSAVKVSEIITALNNLKLVKESLSNECSNENIQIVSDRYDPYTSYVIPKLARDEMGSPVYNYSLKMNFTYAYNDGGGNSSYEVNTPVADGSEVGVAVGFVGAGIACGVSTVIGGGS